MRETGPHIGEEELIAYATDEMSPVREREVRTHLEGCSVCATEAEQIAETLRVFSADPVPAVNVEHAWSRMRASLPPMPGRAPRRRWGWWRWPAAGLAAALVVLVWAIGVREVQHRRAERTGASLLFKRPGPLTAQPVDPEIANHLDSAERLLTEVNHASGPMDETTRGHAHDLLLRNAVYARKAREAGDLPEASVLENLGRVLTTLDHETPATDRGWHIRLEMNTDGLLLDIRILRQNDERPNDERPNDERQNDKQQNNRRQ